MGLQLFPDKYPRVKVVEVATRLLMVITQAAKGDFLRNKTKKQGWLWKLQRGISEVLLVVVKLKAPCMLLS
jgi:hypothetical protein